MGSVRGGDSKEVQEKLNASVDNIRILLNEGAPTSQFLEALKDLKDQIAQFKKEHGNLAVEKIVNELLLDNLYHIRNSHSESEEEGMRMLIDELYKHCPVNAEIINMAKNTDRHMLEKRGPVWEKLEDSLPKPAAESKTVASNLKALGLRVVKQTRAALVIGSQNVREDRIRTGSTTSATPATGGSKSWSSTMTNLARLAEASFTWEKKKAGKWEPRLDGRGRRTGSSELENLGLAAASASYQRAGNCREMAATAMRVLSENLMANAEDAEALAQGKLRISYIYLGVADHALVRLERDVIAPTGEEKVEAVFIDPWLGPNGSFTSDEFDLYKKEIFPTLFTRSQLWSMYQNDAPDEKELAERQAHWTPILQPIIEENIKNYKQDQIETRASIDSARSYELFKRTFDKEFHRLTQTESAQTTMKDKLFAAIAEGRESIITPLLKNVAALDEVTSTEIMEAALRSRNPAIISKVGEHILATSPFMMGDEKVMKNLEEAGHTQDGSVFFIKRQDGYYLIQNQYDSLEVMGKVEFGAGGVFIQGGLVDPKILFDKTAFADYCKLISGTPITLTEVQESIAIPRSGYR